jgi:uncharacterized protein (TIGR04255 family)
MSKLPKAPLIEVIFEIKWTVAGNKEAQEAQYLHGDLYPLLKGEYPYREAVNPFVPADLLMHVPTHRFRTSADDYPLIQVGPGLVTVNTVDSKYFWDDYETRVLGVIEKLQHAYPLQNHHNVHLVLQYIDLIRFDFQRGDVLNFLEENLNISIKQGFYTPRTVAGNLLLILNFPTELGSLNVNTSIVSDTIKPDGAVLKDWLTKSHECCSTIFKDMTRGKLYDSFK